MDGTDKARRHSDWRSSIFPAEADFLPRSWRIIVQSSTGGYVQLSPWDGIAFVTFIVLVVSVLLTAPPAAT